MRKIIIPLMSILVLAASCTSQEEKAQEGIVAYIKENVPGLDSYTPISTTVDSAFVDYATDPKSFELFLELGQVFTESFGYVSEMNGAERFIGEYEAKGASQSGISEDEYNEAKQDLENYERLLEESMNKASAKFYELKERQKSLKIGEYYGWLVKNKFKVMNQNTNQEETLEFLFLMTPDYKVVDSYTIDMYQSAKKLMDGISKAETFEDLQDFAINFL